MKIKWQYLTTCLTGILFLLTLSAVQAQKNNDRRTLMDEHWLFQRGGAQGAEQTDYNDSSWRQVDLPHDWSIEDLPGTHSPFTINAISQVSGGFTVGGTGWYRKHFTIDSAKKGKRFIIQFDGVYMNSEVWLNGKSISKHPYGYTSFWADITERIKYNQDNIIAVKVRNEGENSRWYSGSGIYRHVWLKIWEPIHVAQWGTFVTTKTITKSSAIINVITKVTNESTLAQPVHLMTQIHDAKGKVVTVAESNETIKAGATFSFQQDIPITNPALWSVEAPALYSVVSTILTNGKIIDSEQTSIGIRTLDFDAINGFRLNGKTLKLKGGCIHQDNGPLGAKAFDRADERKIELLKAAGYNAVRCAHNPPSTALLDACDRLGMLVIDESFDCWEGGKNPMDYHLWFKEWWQRDLESMVLRDRNHPSIIMWSIGNEIPNREKPEVIAVAQKLSNYIRQLDSTRPVTCGVNGVEPNKDPFFATLDVAGYNYALDKYIPDHQRLPKRVLFATESFPMQAFDYWMGVEDHSWVIGDFVWTSFDYIGEASIGWLGYPQKQNFYPWNLAYCGDIDVCGWKRPQSYYRDALWKPNQLSLFVTSPFPSFDTASKKEDWSHWDWKDVVSSWNWKGYENKPLEVVIYSSCNQVELFLNNQSLGIKSTDRSTQFIATWKVPYQAGILKAVGYVSHKAVATALLGSAGQADHLQVSVDKNALQADGQDLSYLTIEVVDKKGIRVPDAENLLQFTVSGPGTIAAVGNANPRSIESFQQPYRKAWQGKCLVIIKSDHKPGTITLTIASEGLPSTHLIIHSK